MFLCSQTNYHSIAGTLAGALASLQIVFGLARPGPKSEIRMAFNYGHWFTGFMAHILARKLRALETSVNCDVIGLLSLSSVQHHSIWTVAIILVLLVDHQLLDNLFDVVRSATQAYYLHQDQGRPWSVGNIVEEGTDHCHCRLHVRHRCLVDHSIGHDQCYLN